MSQEGVQGVKAFVQVIRSLAAIFVAAGKSEQSNSLESAGPMTMLPVSLLCSYLVKWLGHSPPIHLASTDALQGLLGPGSYLSRS